MRTRQLGKSGIEVGEIGLGTWGLSGEAYGPMSPQNARRVIESALDEGCNFIDTAACYGPQGSVESVIGAVLADRGRDKAFVATRIGVDRDGGHKGPVRRFDRKGLTALAEASLRRLRVDHVDAFLLHNPRLLVLTDPEREAITTLKMLRDDGKARLIGVSAGSLEVAREALKAEVDLISLPYNVLYSRLLHSVAADISQAKVGVIAHSPLAYGLLADTWGADRVFPEGDHRALRWSSADLIQRVEQREALRPLARGHVLTVREAAIRYVLANGLVSVCVVGARFDEMARVNAHAADTLPYLPPEDLGAIGARLRKHGLET